MTYMIDQHQIKDSHNFMKYEWFECKLCHDIVCIGSSFIDTKWNVVPTEYQCPKCKSKRNVKPNYETDKVFCKICLTQVYPIEEKQDARS